MATPDDWRKRVAAWKSGGLSASAYGARNGFTASQLHQWAHKLGMVHGRGGGPKTTPKPVQLLRVLPRRPLQTTTAGTGVWMIFGGAAVDVGVGFDETTLRRLLTVIKTVSEDAR